MLFSQLFVSVLFVFEIIGLFVAHLLARPNQLRLFIREPYYWYLILIAVGGLVAGLPPLYDPLMPGTGLAVFQVSFVIKCVHSNASSMFHKLRLHLL